MEDDAARRIGLAHALEMSTRWKCRWALSVDPKDAVNDDAKHLDRHLHVDE